MKKKIAAVFLSMIIAVSMLGGCGSSGNESTEETTSDNTIYGEVKTVGEDSITIEVGTMRERQEGEMPSDGEAPSGERPSGGEQLSMLEMTGEEQEIAITEDTTISKASFGGRREENSSAQEEENTSDQTETTVEEMAENGETIELSEISEGDTVAIVLDDEDNAKSIIVMTMGGGQGGGQGGQSQAPEDYDAVNEYNEDTTVEGEEINSTNADENAILVSDGAKVSVTDSSVSRESEDSTGGDNASFYGVGAAILAEDGTAYVSDTAIETDSAGGAGIFAYGDGTVYAADSKITTTKDTSGGIHAAGGGTLYAWDLSVETNGESSAAIRSDRGGGTMVVDGGDYTANGTGSPAVYCTADIAINNADLTATGSEALCIEGLNSARLYQSNLTGNMSDDDQNDCTWNVILYQSMSGDSEVGNSTFEMEGGTITAQNGGMFYTTNTESTITLSDVDITYAKDSEFFLKCTGNANERGWGETGSNGADCLFTAVKQDMEGSVIWDSISQLDFYLTEASELTGAVVNDESCAGDGGEGYCNLYIEEGSTWTVTGDSVLTSLSNEGTIVDASGKDVTIKGEDGTVYVEGNSDYSITVETYNDTADLSGKAETTTFSDYQVERPEEV